MPIQTLDGTNVGDCKKKLKVQRPIIEPRLYLQEILMGSFNSAKLQEAIISLYEAAAQPHMWHSALSELATAVDALGVILIDRRQTGSVNCIWTDSLNDQMDTFLRDQWWSRNYRFERGMTLVRRQGVITESMLCEPEQLDREPLQAEFLAKFGMRWFAGLSAVNDPDADMLFSIERRSRNEAFSKSEIATLQSVMPHIRRAGHLAMVTSSTVASNILWGLSQYGEPAGLLDDSGRVLEMNTHAEKLLGNGVDVVEGRLAATHRGSDIALQRLIGSGLDVSKDAVHEPVALIRQSHTPLVVRVAPIVRSASDLFSRARALLVFTDPERKPRSPTGILAAAFGLTPAETRIALGLAGGKELRRVADVNAISVETARVHLKSIFAKTDTHSQIELVRLLSKLEL
jgi:DNA-binding CsgD family transcriptional regulator